MPQGRILDMSFLQVVQGISSKKIMKYKTWIREWAKHFFPNLIFNILITVLFLSVSSGIYYVWKRQAGCAYVWKYWKLLLLNTKNVCWKISTFNKKVIHSKYFGVYALIINFICIDIEILLLLRIFNYIYCFNNILSNYRN